MSTTNPNPNPWLLVAQRIQAIAQTGLTYANSSYDVERYQELSDIAASTIAGPDPNLLAAALLHDTVEDTKTTAEELIEAFGPDVAALVCELTDDKSLPKSERKRRQVEHAPELSVRAQILKLADKISNLRGILHSPPADWDLNLKREYVLWGKDVVHGMTSPNPVLEKEFDSTLQKLEQMLGK